MKVKNKIKIDMALFNLSYFGACVPDTTVLLEGLQIDNIGLLIVLAKIAQSPLYWII